MDINAESIADWVGSYIALNHTRGFETSIAGCTLLGADEMGVVVQFEQGGYTLKRFFPWRTIEYIHLMDEQGRRWQAERQRRQPPDLPS